MRILVAPDSFKGSLSAIEVAAAMEEGILRVYPQADVSRIPIADGGEGTVEALVAATGGQILRQRVTGPLGKTVEAHWGILGDGETAVIEMAAASGLTLVPEEERNPLISTTYGTGQLIKAALDRGLRKMIIGIGGSATNDGGVGMAHALGVGFRFSGQVNPPYGGAVLKYLEEIDLSGLDPRLMDTEIVVACDVDNPLCGPQGASAVYGPQKGATLEMVAQLDEALLHYSVIAEQATGRKIAGLPGAGAAGGMGAGLLYFTNAVLKPGVEIVLDAARFDERLANADLVITGEGRTDHQTVRGKAPTGVAKRAARFGVPTICLSGGLSKGYDLVFQHGIGAICPIIPRPMSLEESMGDAKELVVEATDRLMRMLSVGILIGEKGCGHRGEEKDLEAAGIRESFRLFD